MAKRIDKLTPEQEALIPVIRERAIQRALFDAPKLDVERAHKAIDWLYTKAGKQPPKFFLHLSSPLALQYAINMLKNPGDQVWAQVGDQVGDQVRDQVRDQVWDQVGDQVWDQVGDQVRDQVRDQVGDQVRDQVWDQVRDQVWDQVGDQVRDQVRDQVWAQVRDQVRDQVWDQKLEHYTPSYVGLGWDSGWTAFYDFFKEAGLEFDTSQLEQYEEILEAGIFMNLLFENVAIVCERPQQVHRSENRLHYDHGPAITWRDGFELYFLHGVAFDKDLYWKVVNREIGMEDILKNIPNADQRSVALVMADPQKFLKQANAKLVSTSIKPTRAKEPTKLYAVPNFMGTGETEYAMTMYCPSTERPFLEWVEPSVGKKHDADLAQATAFGVSKEQYLAIRPDQEA